MILKSPMAVRTRNLFANKSYFEAIFFSGQSPTMAVDLKYFGQKRLFSISVSGVLTKKVPDYYDPDDSSRDLKGNFTKT